MEDEINNLIKYKKAVAQAQNRKVEEKFIEEIQSLSRPT